MGENISGRESDTDAIVSTGPDVCLTPVGGSMVPVAYTSVAFLGESERLSNTVLDNESPDFQLNSRALTSTGHEPGVGQGVVVPGYQGEAFICTASSTVFSEGFATTRHRDPAAINRPGAGAVEPRMERTGYYERILERVEGRPAELPMSAPPGGIDYDELQRTLDAQFEDPEVEDPAPERDLEPGTNRTVEEANGSAALVTGVTAPPEEDHRQRPGESDADYLRRMREQGFDRASRRATDPADMLTDIEGRWEAMQNHPNYQAWDQGISADAFHDPGSIPDAAQIYTPPTGGRFEVPGDPVDIARAMTTNPPFAWAGADGNGYQTYQPTYTSAVRDPVTGTEFVQTRGLLSKRYAELRELLGLPPLEGLPQFRGSSGGKGPRPVRRDGVSILRGGGIRYLGPTWVR